MVSLGFSVSIAARKELFHTSSEPTPAHPDTCGYWTSTDLKQNYSLITPGLEDKARDSTDRERKDREIETDWQRERKTERDKHTDLYREKDRQRERGGKTESLAAQLYSKVIRQTRITRFAEIIVDRRGFCPSWSTVLHMSLVPRHHPCWENESHFLVLTTGEKIQVSLSWHAQVQSSAFIVSHIH